MDRSVVQLDLGSTATPAPSKGILKRRTKLEPRSPGFVLHSDRCNTADFCEFVIAHQCYAIRTFLSEEHQRLHEGDSKQAPRRQFSQSSKHFLKMLQVRPKVPVVVQETSDGQEYGIVKRTFNGRKCGQIMDVDNNKSTYMVNTMKKTAHRISTKEKTEVVKHRDSKRSLSRGVKFPKRSIDERPHHQENDRPESANSELSGETFDTRDSVGKTLLHTHDGKLLVTHEEQDHTIPKPFIETPGIPLSPMKVSLSNDVTQDWPEQSSTQRQSQNHVSSETYIRRDTEHPIAWDFATKPQRSLPSRHGSHGPDRAMNQDNTVAGKPHDYLRLPDSRQQVGGLRNAYFQCYKQRPSTPPQNNLSTSPSSPIALSPDSTVRLRERSIVNKHFKPPSRVSAESTAEDMHSDASSGIFSNAQSAVMMHGRTANGLCAAGDACKLPMPASAPRGALPSLPERGAIAVIAQRATDSCRRPNDTDCSNGKQSISRKSPKKHEYSFFPNDCSPTKPKQLCSPPQTKTGTLLEGITFKPSPSTQATRHVMSVPHPNILPQSTSVGTLNMWQQQRNERTIARKARDMASMKCSVATVSDVGKSTPEMMDGSDHRASIAELPGNTDANCFDPFQISDQGQLSETSELSNESPTPQTQGKSSTSQYFSPIMLVAEQEPSLPPPRKDSHKSQSGNFNINDEPNFPHTNNFQFPSPQQLSPNLQLPESQVQTHPVSAHSIPAPHPIASHIPTTFTNSTLSTDSDRSTHRAPIQAASVSELEARLSALEKKNVLLERAFLSVIDTSVDFATCDGAAVTNGHMREGEGLEDWGVMGRNGSGGGKGNEASGTESLYIGLENLLAVRASEDGRGMGGGGELEGDKSCFSEL